MPGTRPGMTRMEEFRTFPGVAAPPPGPHIPSIEGGDRREVPKSTIAPAASAAFATAFVAGLALMTPQASEAGERVGVAAAVTPQATSKPQGGETKTLKIGKSVFYNERITTSDSGVVQVLLVDGSTFTVGPQSNLVIDKFVYDPRKGSGELAATLSKGALRFVGGKLSKQAPGVKVRTPAGELTVRGGIFQGIVHSANRAVFAFVFGDSIALSRGGRRYTLRESGNFRHRRARRADHAADHVHRHQSHPRRGVGPELRHQALQDQGQRLAVLLRHPAHRPLSGRAFRQGALLRRREPDHPAPRAEPRVRVPNTPQVVRTPPPPPVQTPNTPNSPVITHIPGITDSIPLEPAAFPPLHDGSRKPR